MAAWGNRLNFGTRRLSEGQGRRVRPYTSYPALSRKAKSEKGGVAGQGWQEGQFGAISPPGKSAVDVRLANLVRSGRKQP
ncbi:hypothetical protein AOR01nite_09490 [Acetobacter orleanensis]|uniref:Uncharacterized protein n=1 Tax=Acetobacter orleanensis TaxID=104099 RepID=A0A4Y3TKL7_9PROT|nr:hypothetical protein Abol_009_114 [Acetobacter orleanensis JCM 7639]GEB82472.1 hypothetical protein AOR01nite_09490 [Acetobacter orleanensis]